MVERRSFTEPLQPSKACVVEHGHCALGVEGGRRQAGRRLWWWLKKKEGRKVAARGNGREEGGGWINGQLGTGAPLTCQALGTVELRVVAGRL